MTIPGYKAPNFTQIPNLLIDVHMPDMKEAELRVVLVVARKTFGWHKDSDRISLTQLQKLTGMSRQGVLNGIDAAMARGVIGCIPHDIGADEYFIVVNDIDQETGALVNEVDQPGQLSRLPSTLEVVNEVDTQKKEKESKKENYTAADFRPNVFTIYEANFGLLTPIIADRLIEIDKTYPREWFQPAVEEALLQNVRKLKYVEGILERWGREGKDTKKPGANGNGNGAHVQEGTPIARKVVR